MGDLEPSKIESVTYFLRVLGPNQFHVFDTYSTKNV